MTIKEFDTHYALGTLDTAITIGEQEKQVIFGNGNNIADFDYFLVLKIDDEEYSIEDFPWAKCIQNWIHDSASIDVDYLRTVLIDEGVLT